MIFIVVKMPVRPQYADQFPALVRDFTDATRAESGNIGFEWFRSTEDPNRYVLVESFADAPAGQVHVGSAHFKAAMTLLPSLLAEQPEIIHADLPIDGWSPMAEIKVEQPT